MNAIIPPISDAEYAAYLIRIGDLEAVRQLQDQQVQEGRTAFANGEYYGTHWPAAKQRGYVEAMQDMPFVMDATEIPF